jgi:hypothetical protein
MRLLHILPILSLFFGASASSLDSRTLGLDAHLLDARDVPDVCASLVNQELSITIPVDDNPDENYDIGIGTLRQSNISLSQPISRALNVMP